VIKRCAMKKLTIILFFSVLTILISLNESVICSGEIIINHTNTDLSQISDYWIEQVKKNTKVYFGHTSHGAQIINGLLRIESQYGSKYSVATGWSLPEEEGALCIRDRSDTYDPGDFLPTVQGALSSNPEINVVMYGWCGQPGGTNWRGLFNDYIVAMQSLEQKYPKVTFVYMTGHAQENDCPGCNRHLFNEELRIFARENNKVLFDFSDLDAWYTGELSTYTSPLWCTCAGQSIPREHPHWGGGNWNNPCGHTTYESCDNKGKAMWWLLARIAGWTGESDPIPLPAGSTIITYSYMIDPVKSSVPSTARPIGVGDLSTGTTTARVAFSEFAANVDIYVGVQIPGFAKIELFTPDNNLIPLNIASPTAWKTATAGPIDEVVFTSARSAIPFGQYTVYTVVVPAGTSPATFSFEMSPFYMWNFTVPN